MRKFIKKILVLFLIFFIGVSPAFSKKNVDEMKMVSTINHDFTLSDISKEVHIRTAKDIKLSDDIIIPKHSILTIQTVQAQKERRWHKSGYILGKVKSYTVEEIDNHELYENYKHELYEADMHEDSLIEYIEEQVEEVPIKGTKTVDISDKNLYLRINKYEQVNKKEAVILAIEIIVTQGASFFAPGVDVGYFFLKGAIMRKQHRNFFIAGVMNAYENSIFWFWLKGKPIELTEDSQISVKSIDEEKVMELKKQIEARNDNQELRDTNKQARRTKRALKKLMKEDRIAQKEAIKAEEEYANYYFNEPEEYYDENVEIFQEYYLDGAFVQ